MQRTVDTWEVRVGGAVVLRHKFRPDIAVKNCAVNAVVETFLKSGNVEFREDLMEVIFSELCIFKVWVDNEPPDMAYTRSLERCLGLAVKYMPEPCGLKEMEAALDRVNLSLNINVTQLKVGK